MLSSREKQGVRQLGTNRKSLVALGICVSGFVFLPFAALRSTTFGWLNFAGAYQMADLEVIKVSNAPIPPAPLGSFSYTLTVINNGPAAATGVLVVDNLSPQLTFVSDTCGGNFNPGLNQWTWYVGNLAVAGVVSCDLTVGVLSGAGGTVSNTASVAGDQDDPNTVNNSSTANVAIAPVIPTLSRGPAILMMLLLLGLGLGWVRRRRLT